MHHGWLYAINYSGFFTVHESHLSSFRSKYRRWQDVHRYLVFVRIVGDNRAGDTVNAVLLLTLSFLTFGVDRMKKWKPTISTKCLFNSAHPEG